ncbi:MAG: 3-isopropylmalate dehydratase large subunit [Desulfobacterales bacterium]
MGKTIAEKIFDAHHVDNPSEDIHVIRLDAVFCHEITTPIAINDLVSRNKDRVFDPDKIKAVIDHVTPAKDSKTALQGKILREWARRHNIRDFFDIGRNGICHAIFPEKGFVRPGYTVIMGDSHTCTHGAFGAFAAGVGTTDLEVGILKGICAFRYPSTIKINICGRMPEGVYAKDVILSIIGRLGVNGATNKVLEFTGPVVDAMSMEARMTLCNMAVEAGGTSGICHPDMTTVEYLWEFIKDEYATEKAALEAFAIFSSDPDARYDQVIEHDVSLLEPLVTFGYKPDQVKPVREMETIKIDQVYIGSCTNGRIEDLRVAARVLKGKKISDSVRGIVSPATSKVFSQAMEEGILQTFMDSGFCVTNPTCGACLGMSNGILAEGEVCASTTNRNFNGRMGKGGMIHLVSPATAAATAITGCITNSKLFKG